MKAEHTEQIKAIVDAAVDAAPPLNEHQRALLTAMLRQQEQRAREVES